MGIQTPPNGRHLVDGGVIEPVYSSTLLLSETLLQRVRQLLYLERPQDRTDSPVVQGSC